FARGCYSPRLPLLFLLLPRRPTSPLFPYTTLFRSELVKTCTTGGKKDHVTRYGNISGTGHRLLQRIHFFHSNMPGHGCRDTVAVDRKSTRLNSSHVSISYAVFCLKKKKQGVRKHSA